MGEQCLRLLDAQVVQRMVVGGNGDFARQTLEVVLRGALVPYVQHVPAGRDVGNGNTATAVGDRVMRSVERDDDGAHLRMNVAEDIADPDAVEANVARGSRLVEAEIEARSEEHT